MEQTQNLGRPDIHKKTQKLVIFFYPATLEQEMKEILCFSLFCLSHIRPYPNCVPPSLQNNITTTYTPLHHHPLFIITRISYQTKPLQYAVSHQATARLSTSLSTTATTGTHYAAHTARKAVTSPLTHVGNHQNTKLPRAKVISPSNLC